jgi:hypothetical protein
MSRLPMPGRSSGVARGLLPRSGRRRGGKKGGEGGRARAMRNRRLPGPRWGRAALHDLKLMHGSMASLDPNERGSADRHDPGAPS